MNNTITVTGSNGYIGSHLCNIINSHNCIDNKINLDIRNSNICIDDNVLIHLAALVQVGESTKIPQKYYDVNVNGTINLLNNFHGNHFIFASTGAATIPTSPYALSKKIAEDIIIEHCLKKNINFSIFRFYNVIGSCFNIKPTNPDGLFYALLKAKKTGQFNIYGCNYNTRDGTAVRDYVHVMEICKTIESVINNPTNSIENLGHGNGYTVLELVDKFKQINNIDFKVNYTDARNGDLEISVLDNPSKYMKSLYTIEEMLCIKY